MTHVSRNKLSPDKESLFLDAFHSILADSNKKQIQKILAIISSKTEQTMLYKRLVIIMFLNKGLEIDQIAKITKTTRQTVARIRLQIHEVNSTDLSFLSKRLKSWQSKTTIKEVVKTLLDTPLPTKKVFRNKSR